jgi:hypothetical protein
MCGWTDLNCEIAACWKVAWNVDPAPSMVPLSVGPLLDGVDEHAERATPTARIATPPTPIVIRFLPRGCMLAISLFRLSAAFAPVNDQP